MKHSINQWHGQIKVQISIQRKICFVISLKKHYEDIPSTKNLLSIIVESSNLFDKEYFFKLLNPWLKILRVS